ncbi:polysaccharide pyruvyl transferase [Alginatibacterium sediminis]|uniref:Polysaccharide pyruvyl transferase n=1 Tax=Alginatibacterium sediminis TaxID=2164068 RepID=A0A420E7J5_9ALTE|nr:polysaccharide pyruvyl transferase family protein [Alginatibacterium sediminis]RKF14385.1 polysaccharide pyruvyl transferase [Alginatibacterium sediminis]
MQDEKRQWNNHLQSLKDRHQSIAKLLDGKSIAYVDLPIHFNVGDILIMEGTEQFFEDHQLNVIYRCDAFDYKFSSIDKADVIVFHGGGNFGDLYDDGKMQAMRETLIQRYPNKRIVCLPQTIYFADPARQKQSATIFSQHPDFHFFVRDLHSSEVAKQFTDNCTLMPDMAHSLHPLVSSREAVIQVPHTPRILNLSRIDKEKPSTTDRLQKKSFDWLHIVELQDIAFNRFSRLLKKVPGCEQRALKIWLKICTNIVFRSQQFFYQFDVVETDRLHGAIFGALLGRNIVLYDNSYGKNSRYYSMWLEENPLIQLCDLGDKNRENEPKKGVKIEE